MKLFENKKDCCGCSACVSICNERAIQLFIDEEGFKYPTVDETKCVKCGRCISVCGFKNSIPTINYSKPIIQYAVVNKDENIRNRSTSGGAFSLLADGVVNENGVIYGVQFDNNFKVIHSRTEDGDYAKYCGSKYTQSDIGESFSLVKKDLLNGKRVLFTGTPCQCDGLKNFLLKSRIETSNLILCDIICHGTPSPKLFEDHINTLQKTKSLSLYYCRAKDYGWHAHTEKAVFSDGSIEIGTRMVQKQKEIFYSNLALRPSCEVCPYACMNRVTDLTIGDFWGIEKHYPSFDDNKGCSLILVSTLKGKDFLEKLLTDCEYIIPELSKCIQPNLAGPSPVDKETRIKFWNDYTKHGYIYVAKKYTVFGMRKRISKAFKEVNWILHNIPMLIKRKIKVRG